jgi:nicotinate-nucleotide adenylyltransferase
VSHGHSTIGLLGGSFNPAHAGHIHLSEEAIKRLKLDAIWWLVSPQNPLKAKKDLAPYEKRLAYARQLVAPHKRINVSDFEEIYGLHYSIDTIAALQQAYPNTRFVWLIGADNLMIFHKWRRWPEFFARVPIAVFDRAPFSHAALRSKAALRFRHARTDESDARLLTSMPAPAWTYCFMPRHSLSATQLRQASQGL